MLAVQQLTSDPKQTQIMVLPDGTSLTMTMYFSPVQFGWFASLTYGSFELDNIRLTVQGNLLRQWKNVLPFGMSCFSLSVSREPTQQQDFSSGLFQLGVLTPAEVQAYEDFISGAA